MSFILKTDLFSNTRTKYINKINIEIAGGKVMMTVSIRIKIRLSFFKTNLNFIFCERFNR